MAYQALALTSVCYVSLESWCFVYLYVSGCLADKRRPKSRECNKEQVIYLFVCGTSI